MKPTLLLATSMIFSSLQAEPGNDVKAPAPCQGSDCFQATSLPCDTPICPDSLQGLVDGARTRGPKVDVKATLTAFMKGHPGTALLVAGSEDGYLTLWAYRGLDGGKATSRFSFASLVEFLKATKGRDPRLAGMLLPDPIWARLKDARTLVILPLDGFPKVPFADLQREGWDGPLGKRTKVTVLKRIEQLDEI